MSTPEYERWTGLEIRRPHDVYTEDSGPVPLSWQAEKRQIHASRLANNDLPADFPHPVECGDCADALAVLALNTAMRRDLDRDSTWRIRDAAQLGATWTEIAASLDITSEQARDRLAAWADGQHRLYRGDVSAGRKPFGIDADRHAALMALVDRADDERGPGRTDR